MPLQGADKRMEKSFEERFGAKEGKRRYYATLNARINEGHPIRTAESGRLAKKRKHKTRKHRRKV